MSIRLGSGGAADAVDMALKEQAIARTAPPDTDTARYDAPDDLLAFLEQL